MTDANPMQIEWTTLLSTFLGAFLAASTGYLFEVLREKKRFNKAKQILRTAICDDLKHSLSLYDKIADEWQKTGTVWFATLNELRESRFSYQNNKDWIHLFDDADLRRRIFRYYLQSADAINNLEFQQRRKYEIEGRLSDTVRDIKLKDSSIQHDEALKLALTYMAAENREYENLLRRIPESIHKLGQMSIEARELAEHLARSR
jgi:hypothetical protein